MQFPAIDITNKTLELSDCRELWFYDSSIQAWCLEDLLYTMPASTPKFQRLSIYVPQPYMSAPGIIDRQGSFDGFTADTAPVIFQNNSAGYMQMPHSYPGSPRDTSERYLKAGMVYVTCGNRGCESRNADGRLCGKVPMNLIDLKTAIRFLRHNRQSVPGNLDTIISTGWSAGGAMSALLAVTGNHADFDPYLKENGAFMDESDAVFAAQIYCPITDLEHADLAYEWMFGADPTSEDSPAGPAQTMTAFQKALSTLLAQEYIRYFNDLHLVHPQTNKPLFLGPDGRSGSAYDYLMELLNASVTDYLRRLDTHGLPVRYTSDDYLHGNYTSIRQVMPPIPETADDEEPPTMGDLMARPPKGDPQMPVINPQFERIQGTDKTNWLNWNGQTAHIRDLDSYVLNYRGRMKSCPAFDSLPAATGENRLFGESTDAHDYMHFDPAVLTAMKQLQDEFPQDCDRYYKAFLEAADNPRQEQAKKLYNPLHYIPQKGTADTAAHVRIRVGAMDADTSLSVSMTLACVMTAYGYDTDYAIVWEQPHCEADYPDEAVDWIRRLTLSA